MSPCCIGKGNNEDDPDSGAFNMPNARKVTNTPFYVNAEEPIPEAR